MDSVDVHEHNTIYYIAVNSIISMAAYYYYYFSFGHKTNDNNCFDGREKNNFYITYVRV